MTSSFATSVATSVTTSAATSTACTSRLQIAARIHFLLLREIGQGIDIEHMLQRPRYERDVLLVCDACQGTELARLAQQYRLAMRAPQGQASAARSTPARSSGGHTPQATEWASATSGFGVSQPLLSDAECAAPTATRSLERRLDDARRWVSSWWHR